MADDGTPQTAVTEEAIEQMAVEVFKYLRLHYQSMRGMEDYVTRAYPINGVSFYIDPLHKNGGHNLSFHQPKEFNPLDATHIEALRIALCIYKFVSLYEIVLHMGVHGSADWMDNTSNDIRRDVERARQVFESPFYTYLPLPVQHQLQAASDSIYQEYQEALAFEMELLQEAIQRSKNYGFVYLIQSPTGSYKIGRTRNPDNRMKTFSVKLPFEVDYICTIESADMYALERQLHKKYASKRINGEWFDLDPEDVAAIQGMAVSA